MDLDEVRVMAIQLSKGEPHMTLAEATDYARRVAWNMWRDPEGQSIANYTAWYAYRSYKGNVPLPRWIANCTKKNIWSFWRKLKIRKAELKEGMWFCDTVASTDEAEPELVPYDTFLLLYVKHVEKWCTDVIARRYGWTMRETREKLAQAEEELRAAYADR
jgi:hypothetical protein